MARHTFFSFHYERDAWRAGQVRNCDMLPTEDEHGFIDSVEWESIRKQGPDAIQRWIDSQLEATTVTVVLIGKETAERDWVQREILQSWNRGNGVLGVLIHGLMNQDREVDPPGKNPLDQFELPDGTLLSAVCKVYDWSLDDGRNNLGRWSDEAVDVRVGYGADEVVVKSTVATYPTAGVIRNVNASSGFAPRSPWSAGNAQPRR